MTVVNVEQDDFETIRDRLSIRTQEFDRCQMEGVERSHRDWKRLHGAGENRRRKFNQR